MTRPVPGYTGPLDPGRSADQVMADGAAQNLIRQIIDLHEAMCAKLDDDVHLAALGPADPASGFVTGSGESDRMDGRSMAIREAERGRARTLKNARQRLRRDIQWYLDAIGVPCADPSHHHTVAVGESINYLDGAQRRVG